VLNKTNYCIKHKLVVTFGDSKELAYIQQNIRIQVDNIEKHEITQDVQNENT
jgi:hypothetical protein